MEFTIGAILGLLAGVLGSIAVVDPTIERLREDLAKAEVKIRYLYDVYVTKEPRRGTQ